MEQPILLDDRHTFAQPEQTPAISGNQQAAQSSTYAVRNMMAGSPSAFDPTGLEYEAYKLSQEAKGLKPISKDSWKMMYRHDQLSDGLSTVGA